MEDKKTKFDYEIEAFESAFQDKKAMRIAIYGIGRMTATLISRLEGFKIIGLLDRDDNMIGQKMYGVKVISRKEAEEKADLIVINTSETYWGTIYRRIRNWKVPVYFKNGELATDEFLHENKDNPYWKKNYAELSAKVKQYDVVSFDIFDTLIMRTIYLPADIFRIVETGLQKELGWQISFFEPRKKAAGFLENATIDEIYYEIQKTEGWDDQLRDKIKQYEIEVEKQFIVPRKDMVELFHMVKKTKKFFLISDMYFPKNILHDMLAQCGIDISLDNIIVSCDYKKSKENGGLWEYYKHILLVTGGSVRALHIGDNEETDGKIPQQYGIDSYVVWSSDKMLQESSLENMGPEVNTLFASVFTGAFIAKMFNSPFALQEMSGKVLFKNNEDAGYWLLGGVMYIFCRWLLQQAKKDRISQLGFLAREGYLLISLFEEYCELVEEKNAPEIIYFETSRRVVLTSSIQDDKDILEVASFPYKGNMADFMQDRFGVTVDDENLQNMYSNEDEKRQRAILKKYEEDILREADRERHNYMTYLHSLGMQRDFAIVDSQLYGTTQYYLGKLLEKKLNGYYFCVCLDNTNKYLIQNTMLGCFPGKKGLDGKDSNIYKKAAFIEAFFTAPNGMLECIEDDGSKRYAEVKENQKNFDIRLEMLEGIKRFMKDAVNWCEKYRIEIGSDDNYFMDQIFGVFMSNGFEPTNSMKKGFYYDNGMADRKEVPIWE